MKRKINSLIVFIFVLLAPAPVFASSTYSSTNYSSNQVLFGVGSSNNQSSTNYQAQATAGDLGNGNVNSPDYQAYVGFNTTAQPFLEFVVTAENIIPSNSTCSPSDTNCNSYLTTTATSTANGSFYVRAWRSNGYAIYTTSPPPTNTAGHVLATNSTPTAPASPGTTEQFGMNLVSNTNPVTYGSNPQDAVTPNTCTLISNCVAANYANPNQYAYSQGDEIAYDSTSTSSIIYTASFIYNISGSTPSGLYTFNSSFVAVANY